MNQWNRVTRLLIAAMLALLAGTAQAITDRELISLVSGTVDSVLSRIGEQRAELEKNPGRIPDVVAELLTPYFDFRAMASAAMDTHWEDASESQRTEVVDEFRELLVRTYGTALMGYSGTPIRYEGVRWSRDKGRVIVYTQVTRDSGTAVPINYRLHSVEGQWMVYDLEIDHIHLVKSYRSSFGNTIRQSGIDGLIEKLVARNRKIGNG
ncbi:MAG: ABC transporter substrate-binding protein [Pseudomonadota bacterium]